MLIKTTNLAQKIIEVSFYLLFFTVPFLFTSATSEVFEFNKMLATYTLALVIVFFWIVKSIFLGKIIFKHTVLDFPILLFLLSLIISTYFSIDMHTSIWGYYSRLNGGLLSIFVYSLLYFAYVSNMNSSASFLSIRYLLISASILSLWAISEKLGYSPSCLLLHGELNVDCWAQKVQERPFATIGQPNWLSSWLVAIAPLSWLFLFNKKVTVQKLFFALALLLAVYFTKSDAGYLGLFGALGIFLFFYLPQGGKFKHILLYTMIIFSILFTCFYLWNNYFKNCFSFDFTKNSQEGTSSCQIRSIVWKGALKIWQAYPITGSGVETFALSYYNFRPQEHNLTSEWNNLYNKAHNEYLNYLATTGLLGFFSYLLLLAFIIYSFVKNIGNNPKEKRLNVALLAGFVSLLVTHFFGFSVVITNTLLFLYPAVATANTNIKNEKTIAYKLSLKKLFLLIPCLLLTLYFLISIGVIWYADHLYSQSSKLAKRSWYLESSLLLQKAISLRPNEALYYDKLAQVASYLTLEENLKGNKSEVEKLVILTEDSSNIALQLSPSSLAFHKSRAIIFNRLAEIDAKYLYLTVDSLEKAIILAPTDPEVYYNLAIIYSTLEKNIKAYELLTKTILLKSDYYEGRIGLAQIYEKIGKTESARQEYQWVLNNLNSEDKLVQDALLKLPKRGLR